MRTESRTLSDDLRAYLETLAAVRPAPAGYRYGTYEALVLDAGRQYQGAVLPFDIPQGPMGYCYANTLELVRWRPELTYCEGYAVSKYVGVPLLHAWAVDGGGNVYDRTWTDPLTTAYWGLPFSHDDLEWYDAHGPDYLGILASEYLLGFPLLKHGALRPATMEARHAAQ